MGLGKKSRVELLLIPARIRIHRIWKLSKFTQYWHTTLSLAVPVIMENTVLWDTSKYLVRLIFDSKQPGM